MTNPNSPLKRLLAHWGVKKVAKRYGVTVGTVGRWSRSGLPETRRKEVQATARRVDQALERAALNDDWARELVSRWVAAGNEESDAMIRLRELSLRKRRTRLDTMAIQTWEGLLGESREHRRELGKLLDQKRFRNTPTGRQLGDIKSLVDRYGDRYREAVEMNNPRAISDAWKMWERQVTRVFEELEDLQIPGMSKRQVYTLFFSP